MGHLWPLPSARLSRFPSVSKDAHLHMPSSSLWGFTWLPSQDEQLPDRMLFSHHQSFHESGSEIFRFKYVLARSNLKILRGFHWSMVLKIVFNKAYRAYSLLPAILALFYTTLPLTLWAKRTLPFHEPLSSIRLFLWADTAVLVTTICPSLHTLICVSGFLLQVPLFILRLSSQRYFLYESFLWAIHLQLRNDPPGSSLIDFTLGPSSYLGQL